MIGKSCWNPGGLIGTDTVIPHEDGRVLLTVGTLELNRNRHKSPFNGNEARLNVRWSILCVNLIGSWDAQICS